jgi:cation diffusion facilitator CzcD-associated flavoprotein CzcO
LAVRAPFEASFTELDGELIGPVWTLTGDEGEDVVRETAEDRYTAREVDAIVVGAGFGGIQMAHELTQLGLSVQLIEAGPGVGGVWSWNRYPGARTDIESYQYCFSFSEGLWQEWQWTERYPSQPEVLAYLQFAARRLGVDRYMQFNTRVEAATYDEDTDRWTVVTDGAETLGCRFLVLATGGLSRPLDPPFEGLEYFAGGWYQTARWTREDVDFSGKRVAIIGVGSTGIQLVPIVSQQAAHLMVFQRTPNYVVEAGNQALTDEQRTDLTGRYAEIRDTLRTHPGGITLPMPTSSMKEHTADEVQAMLEESWQKGGVHLALTFTDVMTDLESNEVLCEFIRSKIRSIVADPATAELLCPKNYPFGAKRTPIGHRYYEAFNRDNVTLVDVSADPIERVTPEGLQTHEHEYAVDEIIFAVGFDAITGAILDIDIRGRQGELLEKQWADGPRTYLGCMANGFPNLFFVAGPQTPFANQAVVIDATAGWATDAIRYVCDNDLAGFEPSAESVDQWCAELDGMRRASPVFGHIDTIRSFIVGTNVEGKPKATYFYHAPIPMFRDRTEAIARNGFAEFESVGGQHNG